MARDRAWSLVGAGILTVTVALVIAVVIFYPPSYWAHISGIEHAITRTSNQLRDLAVLVQYSVKYSTKQAPNQVNMLGGFMEETVPGQLEILIDRGWLDPDTGSPLDDWRRPIELVVRSPRDYTFISAGPNGKYEEGNGDDIVYQFDPWKYVEDANKNNPRPPANR